MCEAKQKKRQKRNSNNMYFRPKFLGLNTTVNQILLSFFATTKFIMYYKHALF